MSFVWNLKPAVGGESLGVIFKHKKILLPNHKKIRGQSTVWKNFLFISARWLYSSHFLLPKNLCSSYRMWADRSSETFLLMQYGEHLLPSLSLMWSLAVSKKTKALYEPVIQCPLGMILYWPEVTGLILSYSFFSENTTEKAEEGIESCTAAKYQAKTNNDPFSIKRMKIHTVLWGQKLLLLYFKFRLVRFFFV